MYLHALLCDNYDNNDDDGNDDADECMKVEIWEMKVKTIKSF